MRIFSKKPKATQQTNSAESKKLGRALSGQNRDVQSILHLQQTIGNLAVHRLLHSKTGDLEASSATKSSAWFAPEFNRIPVHASGHSNIQPKLQVNAPGDIYEQEADRVTNQVLRQKTPEIADHKVEIQAKPSPQAMTGNRDINEDLKDPLKNNKGGGNSLSDEVESGAGCSSIHPRARYFLWRRPI
jgi:hypothetical protein